MVIMTGSVLERERKVEREKVKEGLKIWLERRAGEIRRRRKDVGVGILVWRFSRKPKMAVSENGRQSRNGIGAWEVPERGRVKGLRRFWEELEAR